MLTELQKNFFSRLQISPKVDVTFEDLHGILQQMAYVIPYENLDVMDKNIRRITRDNVQKKLLLTHRGGLCYELNSLLYYFLLDCGFDVYRVSGTVYDLGGDKWKPDDGHVIIILKYNNQKYIIDGGLASHLPLHPVPFSGEVISSQTGNYRIRKQNTEKGTYLLEMKKGESGESAQFLNSEPTNTWRTGFAFTLDEIDTHKVNLIQNIIVEHPESPFNKGYIICRLIEDGHISLTEQSFTETKNGQKRKRTINEDEYQQILTEVFDIVPNKHLNNILERG
ncbi:arylamine N-acetyltransferase [Bacillus thuringiensis]|uniref:arylamine N-acetyltransferase family protein n=1 Tax=Bacillus cereus group TaxID=86661 RepID=UPI000A3A6D2D|nr:MULTISPECIES: arylamine N-acetyltransferase [Bacillus cereus group]MED3351785.1 arylamine N-acetyltransferase [Bacillus thuringiensis]MEB9739282.1 arylamine N-acetyltransferase [Bacillus cereus]MRB11979.1 arylamine N-acetyltransferase [Bacillus thuringiensis]OTW81417.1 arylamine N-acetyltransferase [Bacillus thuringiensis serovar jinghongiensis]OTW93194.1 arylamine N-acetyltransferase [Bacillus thuringiensis serovar fukuokaensis]